ncbi:hypothetical protein T439DRAFT_359939 [Meredithblackwellia eburnea MCA 4105]
MKSTTLCSLGLLVFLQSQFSGATPFNSIVPRQDTTSSSGLVTPSTYFGDGFPSSCTTTCEPLTNDIQGCAQYEDSTPGNSQQQDVQCFCTSAVKSNLLSCGNCIVAAGNVSSDAYMTVEIIQIEYPVQCNTDLSFTGIDAASLATLSSAISLDSLTNTNVIGVSTAAGSAVTAGTGGSTSAAGTITSQPTGQTKSTSSTSSASHANSTSTTTTSNSGASVPRLSLADFFFLGSSVVVFLSIFV